MSWKFVLNGANMSGKTIYDIAKVAAGGKYEFFTFNGDVYFLAGEEIHKTRIEVSDLY